MNDQNKASAPVAEEKKCCLNTSSNVWLKAALIVGALFLAFLVFASGIFVGLYKARFANNFNRNNFERNFMQSNGMNRGFMGGMMRNFEGRDFQNGHGVAGTITSINGSNLVVKDRDGKDNNVVVSDNTIIRGQHNNLKIDDLQVNEQIIVIGKPDNNGAINADLIRVFQNSQNNNQNNAQPQ